MLHNLVFVLFIYLCVCVCVCLFVVFLLFFFFLQHLPPSVDWEILQFCAAQRLFSAASDTVRPRYPVQLSVLQDKHKQHINDRTRKLVSIELTRKYAMTGGSRPKWGGGRGLGPARGGGGGCPLGGHTDHLWPSTQLPNINGFSPKKLQTHLHNVFDRPPVLLQYQATCRARLRSSGGALCRAVSLHLLPATSWNVSHCCCWCCCEA